MGRRGVARDDYSNQNDSEHGSRFHFESVNETQLSDFASELKILASDILSFWIDMLEVTAAKPNSNVSS
jgi:hypothetical protein